MAFSPLRTRPVELAQGVEACHQRCLVALGGNQEHVVEPVAVEPALEVEVTLPGTGRCQVGDPLGRQ